MTVMFIKLLIISAVLVGVAMAGLAISILLKPKGRFPDTHISHNREMQKRGIRCAQDTDLGCQPGEGACACAGCSMNTD
jgi:hypothetical protein